MSLSESALQQRVRLAIAQAGALGMRNNVGAAEDKSGRVIRYGLLNESAQQNRAIKSSDLVAVVPVTIQPHHVGRVFGLFGAFECKREGWTMRPGDERAQAQLKFINLVQEAGGIGGFVTHPDHVAWHIEQFTQ